MVLTDHAEDLVEDVADFDVAEGEGAGFDAEDEVLHFESEDFLVDYGVRLAAALHHQVAGAVSVELGDGFEEVEEVGAVGRIEGSDEACVYEDKLRAITFFIDLGELGRPCLRVMAVWAQGGEDLFRDVDGVGWRFGLFGATKGEGDLCGAVEADHDVARVEVGVDKVINEEHAQESVETLVGNFLLEDTAAILEEGSKGDALGEFLDEDLAGGVAGVRVGEPGGGAVLEFFAKHG